MPTAIVIDDDRTTCELVRRSLEKISVETTTTQSFNDGLELVQSGTPDVVLLDIMLPGISGLEVFKTIREIDRKLPVIFITASDSSEIAIQAMQLGGFEYVTKPLDLPALNDVVESALATRRMMNIPVGQRNPHLRRLSIPNCRHRTSHRSFPNASQPTQRISMRKQSNRWNGT